MITKQEQDNNWNELSEESKYHYKTEYKYRLEDSKREMEDPIEGGWDLTVFTSQQIAKDLEKIFGIHNLLSDENRKYFLRFGDLPDSGKSSIYKGETKIGEEKGVSVFECTQDTYQLILPQELTRNLMSDIQGFFNYSDRPLYLVSGIQIGTGTDNEPIIVDARVEKEIPYNK